MQKRRNAALFLTLALLLFLACTGAAGETDAIETVRVGVFVCEGYFSIDGDGNYKGYIVKLFERLCGYAGWKLEWTVGTWPQCMERLENGQVDILGTLRWTSEREEAVDFAERSCGINNIFLIALRSNQRLNGLNLSGQPAITVGVMDGSVHEIEWTKYAAEKGISAELVRFTDEKEMHNALYTGALDAMLSGAEPSVPGLRAVASFSPAPYYPAVRKGNTALLDELNAAMDAMLADRPGLFDELAEESLREMPDSIYTQEELAYIERCGPVGVMLSNLGPTLSQYHADTGITDGVARDLLELVGRKSGLRFEYIPFPEGETIDAALKTGQARIVAPVMQSYATKMPGSFRLSEPLMGSALVAVGRSGRQLKETDGLSFARQESLAAIDGYLLSYYPNALVKVYSTSQEALSAVAAGRADLCFENELVAMAGLKSPYFENLELFPAYRVDEQMRLAVSAGEQPEFLTILNKAIHSLDDRELNAALLQNTAGNPYAYTLGERLYQNRMVLILILGMGAFVVLGSHFYFAAVARGQRRAQAAEQRKRQSEGLQREAEERVIAEHRRNRLLRKQTHFSEAAGILNRMGFMEATRRMLDACPDKRFVIVCWEMDRFGAYGELFGKAEGERLVLSMAVSLRAGLEDETATYGHLGGDCFVCCRLTDRLKPAEMVRNMDRWFETYPKDYEFITRFGIFNIEDRDYSVGMMIDRALIALRCAEGEQFRRYAYYNDDMQNQMKLEQRIITDMPQALRGQQFKVYYQPQYSLKTGCISGVEALARWEHPEYGFIPPGVFIPIFEQNGLITRLSDFIRNEALAQMARWREELKKDVSVAVNVSRVDTFESGFADRLAREVDGYGLRRDALRLEITETAYIQNETHICRVVAALRERGFRVEMDDFGSGFSSLNTLKDLPVDTLKLDMKFLLNSESERGSIILISVVEMARRMRLPMIAEGVETREQAEFLKSIGCDYMQGYYGRRPMPAEEMTELLKKSEICSRLRLNL